MAVDIKTLRVGSHINLCGKRQRIMAIDALNGLIGIDAYKTDENGVKHPLGYKVEDIEPISITPEILKELGFEERRTEYLYGAPDVWYIDSESAQLEKKNNLVVPTITVSSLGKAGYSDWWVIKVITGDKPMRSGNCTVRYLHEAEAFLALHGVELIKE